MLHDENVIYFHLLVQYKWSKNETDFYKFSKLFLINYSVQGFPTSPIFMI